MQKRAKRLIKGCREAAARGRIAILGHDNPDVDSLLSCVLMQRLLEREGIPARIALHTRADGQSRRVLPQLGFDPDAWRGETDGEDALVLVDHHAAQHAGRLLAVVDHHPTDFPPDAPFVHIAPSGACAALVLELMREAGQRVSPQDEALAVTALYLDTIALRSAKILPHEAQWARETAARLGLDEAWLSREGMGLRDMSLPAMTLAMLGKKTYAFGGREVISSYVQTGEIAEEKLQELLSCVREELGRSGAQLWVFLHHNPIAGRTTEYDLRPDGGMETIQYGYLASRGKDVMPRVERMMMRESDERKP